VDEVLRSARTVHQMGHVLELRELAVRASALVHELQKERGLAAGRLGGATVFEDELNEQRALTHAFARGALTPAELRLGTPPSGLG